MKDAYYFPHDSNAQHDQKILQLRVVHGWEGYGLYWAVIESLRDCPDYRLPIEAIPGLSLGYGLPNGTLNGLIETCYKVGLLNHSGTHFWSDSLTRRMQKLESSRKILSDAGKRGAESRWGGYKPAIATPIAVKESKVNKIKEKETNTSLFEKLWSKYPNKDGRKAAERSFFASVKTEKDFFDIESALENYLKSERVVKGFTKNGSTWFNNWRDWVDNPINKPQVQINREIEDKVKPTLRKG